MTNSRLAPDEHRALLDRLGEFRRDCELVLRRTKPGGFLNQAIDRLLVDVDSVAEVITGDPSHFQAPRKFEQDGGLLPLTGDTEDESIAR